MVTSLVTKLKEWWNGDKEWWSGSPEAENEDDNEDNSCLMRSLPEEDFVALTVALDDEHEGLVVYATVPSDKEIDFSNILFNLSKGVLLPEILRQIKSQLDEDSYQIILDSLHHQVSVFDGLAKIAQNNKVIVEDPPLVESIDVFRRNDEDADFV